MFLSNPRSSLLPVALAVAFQLGCSSQPPAANGPAAGELAKGEQPFAAKEPDVYQTEVFYSSGGKADRYFVARNGSRRRFDTYVGDTVSVTELITDNTRYVIDRVRKLYYIDPPSEKGPKAINPAALAFFQNTQHHEFDEMGRADGRITYRAKRQPGDPDQDVVMTIDEATGLMVRQDVKGNDTGNSFTFELKNLRLDAPDDLFSLPTGDRLVSKEEFMPQAKRPANSSRPAGTTSAHD